MIKIIGLGIKDGDLSLRGAVAIDNASKVIVKTALVDTYKFFEEEGIAHETCDHFYENAQDFEDLDEQIANYLLGLKEREIVYCVNGSGYDDRSVVKLMEKSSVEIIAGVSKESHILQAFPTTSAIAVSAYDIMSDKCFNYDKNLPLIIKDIDNIFIAGEIKEILSRIVGDEQKITFYNSLSTNLIDVFELDRLDEYDYSSGVYVPTINLLDRLQNDYIDLNRIMYKLRGKNGCEWDKAQTHESIRKNAIEEAYELVDAIDNQDICNIIEESGDVILQGVFHSIIGEDEGEFSSCDVLTCLCHKLISRHTHIFGDVVASTPEEALNAWENAKALEKNYKSTASKIAKIAKSLPSLIIAEKVQKFASKLGYDFENQTQILAKIKEEMDEFCLASVENREMEAGDMLFATVNLLRFCGIESEVALNKSITKFTNRIAFIENKLIELGNPSLNTTQLDQLWNEAKSYENR